jgi:hypothetical protein
VIDDEPLHALGLPFEFQAGGYMEGAGLPDDVLFK